jgi:lysine decarboxylase
MNGFGSHLDNTGLLGDVAKRAAKNRFADDTVISCSGSTASNHKIMLMFATQFKGRPVLVPRNCHHSIIHSAGMYGVPLIYINNPEWIDKYDAILPPTPSDVKLVLQKHPEAIAVLIVSPTYEGVIADVEQISHVMKDFPDTILWVDQAWGSHLGTSSSTPKSALQLGAQLACESVHKNGGAIQGSALLLWKNNPIFKSEHIYSAHLKEETTSPNFNIFASIDAALLRLSKEPELIDDLCEVINEVKSGIDTLYGKELTYLDSRTLNGRYELDPTRLCIGFKGLAGGDVRKFLENNNIEVEKIGRRSVLLIATFQLPYKASQRVVLNIHNAVKSLPYNTSVDCDFSSPFNETPLEPALVTTAYNTVTVPIDEALGMVCNEVVECYPPGIPVIIPGYYITAAALRYLFVMRDAGAEIVASDRSLKTIRVRVPIANSN